MGRTRCNMTGVLTKRGRLGQPVIHTEEDEVRRHGQKTAKYKPRRERPGADPSLTTLRRNQPGEP